jgi:hypothetical protein
MRPQATGWSGALARRRAFLRGAAAVAVWLAASGHTPYRQWVVYRRRRLLIGCSKTEPASYDLAKRLVAVLDERLPESRARVSRAPDKFRLASLLSTDQMQVALLTGDDARALAAGREPFRDYGAVPLAALYGCGDDYLLVGRADFPEHHAYLVSRALDAAPGGVPGGALPPPDGVAGLPTHPGTVAYARGLPEPVAPEPEPDHDHDHEHGH